MELELKKRFSFRAVFLSIYIISFLIYIGVGFLPAEAVNYIVDSRLEIPGIDLISDVTTLELRNKTLDTPDFIVGSFSRWKNKTLLIGHSTTVFQNLHKLDLREIILYDDKLYKVVEKKMVEKGKILMSEILKNEENDTLVIMTCAGTLLDNKDSTHRLIITATRL